MDSTSLSCRRFRISGRSRAGWGRTRAEVIRSTPCRVSSFCRESSALRRIPTTFEFPLTHHGLGQQTRGPFDPPIALFAKPPELLVLLRDELGEGYLDVLGDPLDFRHSLSPDFAQELG